MSEVLENLERDRAYIQLLRRAGAQAAEAHGEPAATVGFFAARLEPWEPGKTYEEQYSLFTYGGKVGFTRLANVTAQAHQPPFSTGMEAVYGIRPEPDLYGIFPYEYNMAALAGMKLRENGGSLYLCVKDLAVMLWPPSQLPEYFTKIEN